MAKVEFRKVGKTFPGEVRAVDNFDLSIDDGEFIVLVGPSGCGKTTILRMLAGLETLTDGEIQIDDRVVNDVASGDRDVSMVFQDYALFPHLNVFENMAFGLRARNFPKDETARLVRGVADRLGLSDLLERKPAALSGGQRQRVALGRAIARKPKVYLMDEPLSNLDAQLRLAMRKELAALRKELGVTTLYVTHDQAEALTLGDRICVLNAGRIQQIGSPQETYDQPANRFVAGFLGNPPMNFIEGKLQGEGEVYVFSTGNQQLSFPRGHFPENFEPPSGTLALGARPDHFVLPGTPEVGETLSLEVELEHREWQGDHILLHLKGNFGPLVAKTNAADIQAVPEAGAFPVEIALPHCHFFGGPNDRNLLP